MTSPTIEINTTIAPPQEILTVLRPPAPILTQLLSGQGPAGVGLSPALLMAAETMVAGQLVNIFSGGVRKASNDHYGRIANGFIMVGVSSGHEVVVQFSGVLPLFVGLTLGPVWLGLDGAIIQTPPVPGSQKVVQMVGFATSPTTLNFVLSLPVVLAGTPA